MTAVVWLLRVGAVILMLGTLATAGEEAKRSQRLGVRWRRAQYLKFGIGIAGLALLQLLVGSLAGAAGWFLVALAGFVSGLRSMRSSQEPQ